MMAVQTRRSLQLLVRLLVLSGLAAILSGFPWLASLPRAAAQQAGDDALLQKLATRLASTGNLGPDGQPLTVQLLPGQLPSNFRVTIPVPSDASVIGSSVRSSSDGTVVGATVILDVPETGNGILDFYTQAMTAAGFTSPTSPVSPASQGGFQQTFQFQNRYFCQGQSGPSVSVLVFPQPNGPADVHVNADTLNASPCSGPGLFPSTSMTLPMLAAPAGVVIQSGPLGGFVTPVIQGSSRSDATAITAMPVADLETWYAGQLEQAGWTPLANRGDATLAWTTFSVPNQSNAQGFLYVLMGPGNNRRILHLDITTAPGS